MMPSTKLPAVTQSLVGITATDNCSMIDVNTSAPWKNENSLISYETEQLLYTLHGAVLIPLLFLIGAPLNVLNMMVFFKQGIRDRINLCLFSLAMLDLLCLVLVFVFCASRAYWRLKEGEWADAAFRYSIDSGLIGLYGITYGPYFLSAIISTERCVCVLVPLKARQCISTRSLATVIVVGVLVLTSLRFVVLARLKVVCIHTEGSGTPEWAVSMSEFYFRNKSLVDNLDRVFYGFVVVIGCSLIVLITTIVTAVRLQQVIQWRGQTSSALSSKEIVVIKMIMYLSILFAILSTPKVILRFSRLIDSGLTPVGVYRNLYNVLVCLAELSSYTSSVVNFFVYYFNSSKYRETLYSLLPLKTRQNNAKQSCSHPTR